MLRSLLRVSPFLLFLSVGQQHRYEFTEIHMGMPVRIVLYAGTDSAARIAARAAFRRIAELDNTFSDYRPQSEARRLSDSGGEWTPVSVEMLEVLSRSIEIARLTDGAFDPTVAPLVALWREARRTGAMPSAGAIDSARSKVGWRRIALDSVRRAARLTAGTRLDFGGIAKGYIVGEAARELRSRGIASMLVEAGGDIIVGAAPPEAQGWRIDVGDSLVTLANIAISTSGAERQHAVIDGRRYSHVVDPRTGIALTNDWTVRVIGPDPAITDAAATAIGVLGPDGVRLFPALSIRVSTTPSARWSQLPATK
jgi:thiamine biosynthesis lipoprotein